MPKNGHKGFSLIETVVIVTILGIMMSIISVMQISHQRIFRRLQSDSVNQSQRAVIVNEFGSVMRNARAVISSRTFGADSYATSSNTVIVSLPGLDAQGEAIPALNDYAVFRRDAAESRKFIMEIEPDPSSFRPARTRTLADGVEAIDIRYDHPDPTMADLVTLSVDLSRPGRPAAEFTHIEFSHVLGNR